MSQIEMEVVLNCEVEYTVLSRGRPASGPTYSSGGEPAEYPEYEIKVVCNGIDITAALSEEQLEEAQGLAIAEVETPPDYEDDDS